MWFGVLKPNEVSSHVPCVHVAGLPADAGSAQSVRAAVTEFGASYECDRPRGGSARAVRKSGPAGGPKRLGAPGELLFSLVSRPVQLLLRNAKRHTLLLKQLV